MALSMTTTALTTTAFFMSFMAATPAGFRYKNGKTTAQYDQQDPDYKYSNCVHHNSILLFLFILGRLRFLKTI